jgi:serine/threonine protein kinase
MIRWFSVKRFIVPALLIIFLLFFFRLNRRQGNAVRDLSTDLAFQQHANEVKKAGGKKKVELKDLPMIGEEPLEIQPAEDMTGIDERKLSKAAPLVLSPVISRPFELKDADMAAEFDRWAPKKESFEDFLWRNYRVVPFFPKDIPRETFPSSDRAVQLGVFRRSILRHVSIFYGEYLRGGGKEPRHLPMPNCGLIGLDRIEEQASKVLDSLAGSQGDVKFKQIPYYSKERSGPFMADDNGAVWMVAKYFNIKDKKKKKKKGSENEEKVNKRNIEKSRRNYERELDALRRLSHPNIVHGVCHNEARLEIVYPFLRGGDLVPLDTDVLGLRVTRAGGRTSELLNPDQTFLPRFARQLVLAVAHMHEKGLVHFDLKPENFVVAGPNRQFIRAAGSADAKAYDLVLIDFGLAEHEADLGDECMKAGTEVTMAPEQIMCNNPVGYGTDWWGVAAGLYRVRCFWEPTVSEDTRDQIMHLRDPQWGHPAMPQQPFFDPRFTSLLETMLKPTPEKREFDKHIETLLNHPYIKTGEL